MLVSDGTVLALMRLVWATSPAGELLVGLTLSQLEAWFRSACAFCCLPARAVLPSSLRAGGATASYLSGLSLEKLMWRGRWESVMTLRHYIQEAAAAMVEAEVPSTSLAALQFLARDTVAFAQVLIDG